MPDDESTVYPADIDAFIEKIDGPTHTIWARYLNKLQVCLNKVEQVLGVNPQGSSDTVATRLALLGGTQIASFDSAHFTYNNSSGNGGTETTMPHNVLGILAGSVIKVSSNNIAVVPMNNLVHDNGSFGGVLNPTEYNYVLSGAGNSLRYRLAAGQDGLGLIDGADYYIHFDYLY